MSLDILSSFVPLVLALFLVFCLVCYLYRAQIRRWWNRGEAIEGFSRQKMDRERHKEDLL